MNKRVLYCIPSLYGGGAERQLAYLCPKLIDLGWEVHVALLHYGPNYERLAHTNVTLHNISHRSHYDPMLPLRLYRVIREIQPDIVQTWLTMMNILGGAAAILAGKRWVLSERNSPKAYIRGYKSYIRRLLGCHANMIIANSSAGLCYWRSHITENSRLLHVPNALPFDEIDKAVSLDKTQWNIREDEKVVIFIGRLVQHKNVDKAIAGFSKIAKRLDAVLVICGVGPAMPMLKELSEDLGVEERVRFLGYVSNVYDWLKTADALIMPSIHEGMPNVVMEAAACGCPLVVSDIPEHREILTDDMAWFVNPQQTDAIANTLKSCLTKKDMARIKATLARQSLTALTPAEIARQYDRCYRDLIGENGART